MDDSDDEFEIYAPKLVRAYIDANSPKITFILRFKSRARTAKTTGQ